MHAIHGILGLYKRLGIKYVDDMQISFRGLAEHKMYIDTMLQRIRAAHLRLNTRRCIVAASDMSIIGFKVISRGVHPKDRWIPAINGFPVTLSTLQCRSFVGSADNHGKFVHKFALWTMHFHALTANKSSFRWIEKPQAESSDIRRALASAPRRPLHNAECSHILCADASDVAVGGVLAQKQLWEPEGRQAEHLLGFISRTLSDFEIHYPVYDHELLAIHNNLIH